ncbi:CidA/LrgA family protein [Moraxella bovis]|uniref:CidA/LrgA family protein n=1 Tax=Moraxella bovis TaxID=476 RepID=A0AAQ2Q2K7_MORBO|nr:CidA/LrgA family protein [Moraxella bovis]AWY20653.1 CidA/LrgA family protein [Moraxella bovis]OOR92519.1 murein hydrolase regulator LrgA [Moraxella bovis]UYZ76668.1 CidA/LrgA family protein [Moraxella bovis]UYZ77379.1 CidA/LrgA family protein [Moraxella bovis]UYZ82142.1 CidA/LrgA family protein [Moraxella bovis]
MILKAFLIIFGCVFLGEIFIALTGLSLPPSVIGLIILFGALQAGVIKLETVQSLAKTLLDYLVLMVVPACISITQYLDIIRVDLGVLIGATAISTLMVLIVTGKSYEWLRHAQKARHQGRTNQGGSS